jgi:hypothetical protein
LVDIRRGGKPLDDPSRLIANRLAPQEEPAKSTVMTPDAMFLAIA